MKSAAEMSEQFTFEEKAATPEADVPGDGQGASLWGWNREVAGAVGVPADFVPSHGDLRMVDHEYPPLSEEQVAELEETEEGRLALADFVSDRHRRIWKARQDPLMHGWELPHWPVIRDALQKKDEVYVFGANDSAKSKFLARIVCEVLTRRCTWPTMMAGAPKVLCIAQNDTVSKQIQQSAVYEELPRYVRAFNDRDGQKRRSTKWKVNYSPADGFTGGTFVLPHPRGAQCWFRNVAQWEHGELSFEGAAYHLVAIDEDLPLGMLEALQFRAAKCAGKILYCFTSVKGFNPICKNVLTGARLVKALPMNWEWLRPGAGEPPVANALCAGRQS